MLQSLLEALPDLFRGDCLQIRGGKDPIDNGRVLRSFCWEDWLLLALTPLNCPLQRLVYTGVWYEGAAYETSCTQAPSW